MKQTKKLQIGDSFTNWMMANNSTVPVEGQFCTELQTLDRYSHLVSKVISQKELLIEHCDVKHDSSKISEMGHQDWISIPTGQFFTIKFKYGAWRKKSGDIYRCLFGEINQSYRCWEF